MKYQSYQMGYIFFNNPKRKKNNIKHANKKATYKEYMTIKY